MKLTRIEAYDRREVEYLVNAIDRKLDTILQLLESRMGASKTMQPIAMPAQTAPRLALGINEAAKAIGVSPDTLRRRIGEGKLEAVRFGRRVLIRRENLERLISGGKTDQPRTASFDQS
jgi:excisionase family DNA binding protein